jgi:hypothetical protein
MLSGANAFEISDIQEDETQGSANQPIRMQQSYIGLKAYSSGEPIFPAERGCP